MLENETVEKAAVNSRVMSGADQFYWIAGLGTLSALLYGTNLAASFPLGVALTQLLTGLSRDMALPSRAVAALAVLAFLGVFLAAGYFGRKGEMWAFILGGAVYLADAVLFIILGDWISVAVHAFFLYYILRGLLSFGQTV